MAINRTAKKYGWLVGAVMATLMIGGVVLSGLGGNIGGRTTRRMITPGAAEEPVIATVGSQQITKSELDQLAQRLVQQQTMGNPMLAGKQPTPEQMDQYRLGATEVVKQQEALRDIAKQTGVTVTDADLRGERDKRWASQVRAGVAQQLGLSADADDGKVSAALANMPNGMALEAVKNRYLPDESLRLSLLVEKLTAKYKTQIAADEPSLRRAFSDMTIRHVLIKFGAGALPEEQAKVKADKLLVAVKSDPTKMGDLAKANSDDPGSKLKGGVYEWTPTARKGIVPEFQSALETLKPGETYGQTVRVVSPGYSGFHIIRLEAVKEGKEFPKDFDKNKAALLARYVGEHAQKRIEDAVKAAEPFIKVTLSDPALQAEQYLADAQKATNPKDVAAKRALALAELSKIRKEDDPLGIAPLKKAQLLTQSGKTKEAIAAYEDALTYRSTPETRLALAQAYVADKQNDKAKEQLAKMEEGVIPDPQMEGGMAQLYDKLGETDKAKAAKAKAEQMSKQQIDAMMKQFKEQQAKQPAPSAPRQSAPAKK